MMLRVLPWGERKRGEVLVPPGAWQGGGGWGPPRGDPPALAVLGCTILEVSAGSGICWGVRELLLPHLQVMLGGWSPMAVVLGHRCCIPASNAGLTPSLWHRTYGVVAVTFATGASLADHRLLRLPPQLPGEGCDPWAGAVWGCPANLLPVSLSGHPSPSCGTGTAPHNPGGTPRASPWFLSLPMLGYGSGAGR